MARACIRGLGDYGSGMRLWISILMVLGWLGYGLMPALAMQTRQTIAMFEPDMAQPHAMSMAAHGDHDVGGRIGAKTAGDCNHCKGMSHAASCPGCQATVPDMHTASFLSPPFRYSAPWRSERLTTRDQAPPTPPPRS